MALLRKVLTFVGVLFVVGEFSTHLSFIDATTAANVAPKPFPFEKPLMGFAIGTVTSTLLQKLLHLEKGDKPKCALSISNKMKQSRLINPFLYIEHGEDAMPVPLKVDTNSSVETLFEAASDGKDTSGLLFYEIENTKTHLLIFWKITGPKPTTIYMHNRFHLEFLPAVKFTMDEATLRQKYIDNKAFAEKMKEASDFTIIQETLWIPSKEPNAQISKFQATVRAQMTMSKQAEFSVEIVDDLPPPVEDSTEPQFCKRSGGVEVAFGIGLIKLMVNLAFKKALKYIPSEQTGTILIENASENQTMLDPSWYISSGLTTTLIPWEINPSETAEMSYSVQLFGENIKEAFKHTVFFMSYQIQGTDYYVVVGTWFPFKLQPGGAGIFHRAESLFTLFVMERSMLPQYTMKLTVKKLGETLVQASGNIEKFNQMIQASNKYIYDAIPNTNTNAKLKIVGVKATKFETYREWQYPIFGPKAPKIGATREEFHIKIAASVGVGKSSGVSMKVEVIDGPSPDAKSFLANNPQIYKEPPKAIASTASQSSATSAAASGTPVTSSARPTGQLGAMRFDTGTSETKKLGQDVTGTFNTTGISEIADVGDPMNLN